MLYRIIFYHIHFTQNDNMSFMFIYVDHTFELCYYVLSLIEMYFTDCYQPDRSSSQGVEDLYEVEVSIRNTTDCMVDNVDTETVLCIGGSTDEPSICEVRHACV